MTLERKKFAVVHREWDELFECALPLDEMIEVLVGARNEMTAEQRASAKVDLENVGYDSPSYRLKVTYDRIETDDEFRLRCEREASITARREAEERATLATLKAKYERGEK